MASRLSSRPSESLALKTMVPHMSRHGVYDGKFVARVGRAGASGKRTCCSGSRSNGASSRRSVRPKTAMAKRFVFSTARVQPPRSLCLARFGLQAFILSVFHSPRWLGNKSAGRKALRPVSHPPLGMAMAWAYSTDLRVRIPRHVTERFRLALLFRLPSRRGKTASALGRASKAVSADAARNFLPAYLSSPLRPPGFCDACLRRQERARRSLDSWANSVQGLFAVASTPQRQGRGREMRLEGTVRVSQRASKAYASPVKASCLLRRLRKPRSLSTIFSQAGSGRCSVGNT